MATKGEQIAAAMKMTYEKRRHQTCRVFELKVEKSRLNETQKERLKMIFVEAKWCFNYLINKMNNKEIDISTYRQKELDEITHKDKDRNDVDVKLSYIGSSMKLALIEAIRSNIKTLRSLKKKGKKTGRIKFKSEYNSIELKQYGIVYQIVGKNRIKVQGIKKPLPVNGLKQIEKYGSSYDIANAKLIRRHGDYYINITIFYNDVKKESNYINDQIGIDFGCQTSLTLSNGEKIDVCVEESDRLKRLQRKLNKQEKGSNNRYRTRIKLRKEYDRLKKIKDDKANKVVHKLLSENRRIIIQDEQINSWKVKHGRKIQHSILGRVKSKLLEHNEQVSVINRFVPTTKFCHDCGCTNDGIQLWDRTFVCPGCGVEYDRDVHAAMNMVWLYNNLRDKIGLDGSEFKRAEFDEEVHHIFGGWDSQTVNHEDAKSLA